MAAFNVPPEWVLCSFSDLVSSSFTGLVRSAQEQGDDRNFQYLKMNNLDNKGNFLLDGLTKINAEPSEVQRYSLQIGDFIFNTRNSAELVGKCGVFGIESSEPILFNNNLLKINFFEVEPRIVAYWLNSPTGKRDLREITSATTSVAAIYQKQLFGLVLAIPPLAEQKVIADKLDTLLAQVETTKARLERIPEILKSFRQSVLTAAVSGKLTEEWREQNSAEKLKHVFLGDVIDGISQGWSPQCLGENTDDSSWGVIKTSSVQEIVFLQNENKKLPPELDARPEFKVNEGDILTTRAGPRTRCGVTCYVENVNLNLMLCDKVYRYRVNPQKGLSKYLALQLNELSVLEQIELLKTGISESGMNLTQSKFKELTLTWPSLAEQTEIVRRVEQLFAFADSIEQKANAALSRVNNLTQSILAKAFRGELTADWRAANPDLITGDNSAEALLAKIKAERAKLAKKTKAKA